MEVISTKLRYSNVEAARLSWLVFSISPGLASESIQGDDSVSREIFQELVVFVEIREMDLILSTLKKSLLNQFSGMGSRLFNASGIKRTSFGLLSTRI